MVASHRVRKVVCCVVRVPKHSEQLRCHSLASGSSPRVDRSRPSDLLPWADPYIAQLVRDLQHEVRSERSRPRRQPALTSSPISTFPMDAVEPSRGPRHPDRQWPLAEGRDFHGNTTGVRNRR